MNARAQLLHAAADDQLATLTDLISAADESMFRRPCAGREKLGDGTVGALAIHTIQNYDRILTFVGNGDESVPAGHADRVPAGHRRPRWVGKLGHQPPAHGPGMHDHDGSYTADSATPAELTARLSAVRAGLQRISRLTDQQLDAVPPQDSFRFCDGQRTLEQVIDALLRHQAHQVQMLSAALAQVP